MKIRLKNVTRERRIEHILHADFSGSEVSVIRKLEYRTGIIPDIIFGRKEDTMGWDYYMKNYIEFHFIIWVVRIDWKSRMYEK